MQELNDEKMKPSRLVLIQDGKEMICNEIVKFRADEIVGQIKQKVASYSKKYSHYAQRF